MDQIINFDEIKENDAIPSLTVTLDKEKYNLYNKMVREINPLHFDLKYAQSIGFENIVVAGVYTYCFVPKMLIDWTGNPHCIKKIQIRFIEPAYLQDTLIHKGVVEKKYIKGDKNLLKCRLWVENQLGEKITTAHALLELL